jgi:hypothetical protein
MDLEGIEYGHDIRGPEEPPPCHEKKTAPGGRLINPKLETRNSKLYSISYSFIFSQRFLREMVSISAALPF